MEALEQGVERAVRNPRTVVLDHEPDPVGIDRTRLDHDPRAGARERERVVEQVGERLVQEHRVDEDGQRPDVHMHVVAVEARRQPVDRPPGEVVELEHVEVRT